MKRIILLLVMAILFLCGLLPLLHPAYFQQFDIELLSHVNLRRNVALDTFFCFITDSAGIVSFLLPVVLLVRLKTRQQGIYSACAYLLSALTSNILKYSVNRPRPFVTYSYIEKLTSGGSPSFPSGHTTDAFVTAAVLSIVCRRWYATLLIYTWAFLVAYSRMDLGVHYPGDVLAGAALGTFAAVLCYGIGKKIQISPR